MGLIKALKDAAGTVMADQWLEYFYCDSLPNDVLVAKGQKKVNAGRNSNTKGSENIITNGSVIAVNDGQCMIIVDQGEVVEVCADPGEFIYDSSTEPSIFAGNLGNGIVESFKKLGRRFAFGGNTAHDQRVYYFNTKQILNNLYGTATPIEFHVVSKHTGYELETTIRANGQYSFRIVDPILFYKNVCGNVVDKYTRNSGDGAQLLNTMKEELLTALPPALAHIGEEGVLPWQVAGKSAELAQYLQSELTSQWTENRGIEVVTISIKCSVSDEDREKINKWNDKVMMLSSGMQQAAISEGMANMLNNSKIGGENGGSGVDAMAGIFSMGMMQNMMNGGIGNMMGGMNPQAAQMQQNPQMQAQTQAAILGWTCACGHQDNRGKFCAECGAPKPQAAGWTCSCGTVNQGKFCQNCGSKKPEGAPLYKCDKCGWEPEDPTNPPKFCPECGDVFDEKDLK